MPHDIPNFDAKRDLALALTINAPRAAVWRCWTEPELVKQWFAPAPWTTPSAELDPRPGGTYKVTMRSPEGTEVCTPSVYLEVVPGERIVATDAFSSAWVASEKPFMTVTLTFADAPGGGTQYVAHVQHWSEEDCETHAKMGFEAGWTQCAKQLETVARTLMGGK